MKIISKCELIPIVNKEDKVVPKSRSEFTPEETKKVVKSYRALNILFCGLDSNELSHVCEYDTAKEVFDTLETTYQAK